MTITRLNNGTDAFVLSTKPDKVFGGPARLLIDSNQAGVYFHFPLGSRIPRGATILSARLIVRQVGSWSGSTTLVARAVERWNVSRLTWNNRPSAQAGSFAVSVTQSGTPDRAPWEFDVTADVARWSVAGFGSGERNYGWRVFTDSTNRREVRGFNANTGGPVLVVEWSTLPPQPTDLNPSFGAVSAVWPVLGWSETPDQEAFQVQINSSASASGSFDTGEILSASPTWNWVGSSYIGVPEGSTRYWRVRVRNDHGWSEWSEWVSFSRLAKPSVTITNPGAVTNDPTPPITWTSPGQTARRVLLYREDGDLVEDSGWQATTETVYTPTRGARWDGESLRVLVRTRDDVARESTPGDPDFARADHTFTFAFSASTVPVSSFTVEQVQKPAPWIRLRWDRGELPDRWHVIRDGVIIASLSNIAPASEVSNEGYEDAYMDTYAVSEVDGGYEWVDWTAAPNVEHTYRVAPVVNNVAASGGSTASITAETRHIWLADPNLGTVAVLGGQDEGSWAKGEDANLYTPVGAGQPVRIRTSSRGLEGSMSGDLAPAHGYTFEELQAALESFDADTSRTYRLALADFNIPVLLGDITQAPSALTNANRRCRRVSFSFWQNGDI